MQTIWKFPLEITDIQHVKMPKGAKILSVHNQGQSPGERPMLWAMVNPEAEPEEREIHIAGTGHMRDLYDLTYIGSAVGPIFVWHVFENVKGCRE